MWLLVLILSIKLQMPTWYFVIFTVITIFRPLIGLFKYKFNEHFFEEYGNK